MKGVVFVRMIFTVLFGVAGVVGASQVIFVPATELEVLGMGFDSSVTPTPYSRLPSGSDGTIRADVYDLSLNSAGVTIEFASNAPEIYLNYTLASQLQCYSMWHMPSTGVSGVDLYAFNDFSSERNKDEWLFVGNFGPPSTSFSGSIGNLGSGTKKYRAHLPLYNTVNEMEIGVEDGFALKSSKTLDISQRVLWYGTSIAQGAVASRPGTTFTNVIRNAIGVDVVNLGFSGNCLMELDVASWLVEVSGVAAVVVDCLPNMNASLVTSNTVPLVNKLRAAFGDNVPIILAEGTTYGSAWISDDVKDDQEAKRSALTSEFNNLIDSGMKNLYYVKGEDLGKGDLDSSPTVEGTHLTDIGHAWVAEFYSAFLPTVMQK